MRRKERHFALQHSFSPRSPACCSPCLLRLFIAKRAVDEPFSGYAVMASPRDMHVITTPIRLSAAPDLTLNRGTLYADGNAAAGTPISRFVLDGPVFYLNARACAPPLGRLR